MKKENEGGTWRLVNISEWLLKQCAYVLVAVCRFTLRRLCLRLHSTSGSVRSAVSAAGSSMMLTYLLTYLRWWVTMMTLVQAAQFMLTKCLRTLKHTAKHTQLSSLVVMSQFCCYFRCLFWFLQCVDAVNWPTERASSL